MSYRPRNIEPGTYPFPRKQVPMEGQKTFSERIKDIYPLPQGTHALEPVNIGFSFSAPKRSIRQASQRKPELEALARRRLLKVSIEDVHESKNDFEAPLRRMLAARHYGLFEHLFGQPHYFYPVLDLPIFYELPHESELVQPVYSGNFISAETAKNEPLVDLTQLPKGHLWTIVMTSPDEPMSNAIGDEPSEYIHWMVSNINPDLKEDGAPKSGDLIIDYFPPLPYYGTGFHRYAFILYCQDKGYIDFSSHCRGPLKNNLQKERVFSTIDFYRTNQERITPAGLAFFQSTWDPSVRTFFREKLPDMSEPIFEVEWPTPLPPPQARFPLANSWHHSRRHPEGLPLANSRLGVHEDVSFDVYLDRYRDRKELNTEILLQRLENEGNPLNPHETNRVQPEFPMALPIGRSYPSWWKQQEAQRRLRRGRWRDLDGHED